MEIVTIKMSLKINHDQYESRIWFISIIFLNDFQITSPVTVYIQMRIMLTPRKSSGTTIFMVYIQNKFDELDCHYFFIFLIIQFNIFYLII